MIQIFTSLIHNITTNNKSKMIKSNGMIDFLFSIFVAFLMILLILPMGIIFQILVLCASKCLKKD